MSLLIRPSGSGTAAVKKDERSALVSQVDQWAHTVACRE